MPTEWSRYCERASDEDGSLKGRIELSWREFLVDKELPRDSTEELQGEEESANMILV